MSKFGTRTFEDAKASLKECHANGWVPSFSDALVSNQYVPGFLTDPDVKKWTAEFLKATMNEGHTSFLPYTIGKIYQASTVWSQLGTEFMASALGLVVLNEDRKLGSMLRNLDKRMPNRAAFQDAAAPIIAEVLDVKVDEYIDLNKEMAARNSFSLGDGMEELLMNLMPYPALLAQSGSALARHIEWKLENALDIEEMDDEEIKGGIDTGKAFSEAFTSKLNLNNPIVELSDDDILAELAAPPKVLTAVMNQPVLRMAVCEHCETVPESFARTLKALGAPIPA